jgi:predicted nucleotidyltransferase
MVLVVSQTHYAITGLGTATSISTAVGTISLKFVALKYQLCEILGKDVDLVMKTALKPKIGERILEEVIYI